MEGRRERVFGWATGESGATARGRQPGFGENSMTADNQRAAAAAIVYTLEIISSLSPEIAGWVYRPDYPDALRCRW